MNRVLMITLPFATRPHPTDPNSVVVDLSDGAGIPLPTVEVSLEGVSDLSPREQEAMLEAANDAAEEAIIPMWVRAQMKAKLIADPSQPEDRQRPNGMTRKGEERW